MRENILKLMGLMRRANAIAIGEVNSGSAARDGKAKLLLVAADASANARKRAEGFSSGRDLQMVELPFSKEELSANLGVNGCSMAAVTDPGFARALMKALAEEWPEYAAAAEETAARQKKAESPGAAGERNKKSGKRRTKA